MGAGSHHDPMLVCIFRLFTQHHDLFLDVNGPFAEDCVAIFLVTVGFNELVFEPFDGLAVHIFEGLKIFFTGDDWVNIHVPGCVDPAEFGEGLSSGC